MDMLTLFTFLYYYVLRFYDQADPLVSVNSDNIKTATTAA
jgi:hypothetical protein